MKQKQAGLFIAMATMLLFLIAFHGGAAFADQGNTGKDQVVIRQSNASRFSFCPKDLLPVREGDTLYSKLVKECGLIPNERLYRIILALNPGLYNVNMIYPGKVYKAFQIISIDESKAGNSNNSFFVVGDERLVPTILKNARLSNSLRNLPVSKEASAKKAMREYQYKTEMRECEMKMFKKGEQPCAPTNAAPFSLPLPDQKASGSSSGNAPDEGFSLPLPPQK